MVNSATIRRAAGAALMVAGLAGPVRGQARGNVPGE